MIKKRNLDPSLIYWIMNTTGLGPGIGDVHYLVDGTSQYYTQLLENGQEGSKIHHSIAAAYAAMTGDRNDVLMVFPGNYVSTASLAWAKNQTHIIGLGGPNQRKQPTTLPSGGVRLSAVTQGVAEILNITGHYVQVHGIGTFNNFTHATNYCDVRVNGRNFYAKNCSFRGGNGALQLAADGSGVPLILGGVAGGGNSAFFENCYIGDSGNNARTKGPGGVLFPGGAAGCVGVTFKQCTFSTRIETASADFVGFVKIAQNYSVDRELLFDECFFYNFWNGDQGTLTNAIRDGSQTSHQVIFRNCVANKSVVNWTDNINYVSVSSGSASHLTGGIGVAS